MKPVTLLLLLFSVLQNFCALVSASSTPTRQNRGKNPAHSFGETSGALQQNQDKIRPETIQGGAQNSRSRRSKQSKEYHDDYMKNKRTAEQIQYSQAAAKIRYENKKDEILSQRRLKRNQRTPEQKAANSAKRKANYSVRTPEQKAMMSLEARLKSLKKSYNGETGPGTDYSKQHTDMLENALRNPLVHKASAIQVAREIHDDWKPTSTVAKSSQDH